ncbi:polysialyltransferase family glycosyltransferase [Stutzerimonas stutzeri]|uniref:polysialyltransferase family glycosyltransferase n=1 Tax=Stutzerimonas stutzeri TaxID=316 RepID=UPI000AF3CC9C|nr:hypothetical protein [Stutzerimonas stutzeri]
MAANNCNVFICNSPLQILNAYEARHQFSLDTERSVLVIVPLTGNLDSLLAISRMEEWADIVVLKTRLARAAMKKHGLQGFLKKREQHIRQWQEKVLRYQGCVRVFVAHTGLEETRMIAAWLRPGKITYIDDGTLSASTLEWVKDEGGVLSFGKPALSLDEWLAQRKSRKNISRFALFTYKYKELLGWVKHNFEHNATQRQNERLGVCSGQKYNHDVFSVYVTADDGRLIANRREYMRSKISDKKFDNNVVHFLGAPFVERKLVLEPTYMEWLESVKDYFAGRELIYVLHPAESDAFASRLVELTGIKCLRFGLPYEVVFATSEQGPAVVASWFCSALENINDFCTDEVQLFAFKVGMLGAGTNNVHRAAVDFYARHQSGSRIQLIPVFAGQKMSAELQSG